MELLRAEGEYEPYTTFRRMTEIYFSDFAGGNQSAIAAMIDFYGGAGTFVSWPPRVRAYVEQTTPVNVLDWATAYAYPLSAALLANIRIPALIIRGGASHPAMQRANALLSERIGDSKLSTIDGAAHFMIATHADELAQLIAHHVGAIHREFTGSREGIYQPFR